MKSGPFGKINHFKKYQSESTSQLSIVNLFKNQRYLFQFN
jgi:hypothetical protein